LNIFFMKSKAYNKTYKRKTFDPKVNGPKGESFSVSRSKIDLFMECPRCFYLDLRHGISRPSTPPFTLNSAVDTLLKKEFDIHRAEGTAHPLMKEYGVKVVPFPHPNLSEWRHNFTGVRFLHKPTNFLVFGAIDDIWTNEKGELFIVDYKATSKDAGVKKLEDTRWHNQYKRQMEIYQWLFKQNGFDVSDTGYFVYVNGRKDKEAFDGKLEFDANLISYTGKSDWIPAVLQEMLACLQSDKMPRPGQECQYCGYSAKRFELAQSMSVKSTKFKVESKKEENTGSMFEI